MTNLEMTTTEELLKEVARRKRAKGEPLLVLTQDDAEKHTQIVMTGNIFTVYGMLIHYIGQVEEAMQEDYPLMER